METFHLPMREVRKKYTASELSIMSWRSKEMSANMTRDRTKSRATAPVDISKGTVAKGKATPTAHGQRVHVEETDLAYVLPEDINAGVAIPKTFFDDDGNMTLSKATGPQAVRYLQAIGFHVPTVLK